MIICVVALYWDGSRWSEHVSERGRVGKVTGPPGQCLDVSGNNPLENKVVQYTCNGSVAQSWVAIGGVLRGAGKCLDVSGGATAAGTGAGPDHGDGHHGNGHGGEGAQRRGQRLV